MSWIIIPSKAFKSRYKTKRSKGLKNKVDEALRFLVSEPEPWLYCRKKYGRIEGIYGYDLDDENRILMNFNKELSKIHLLRVCSHKEVYGVV